MWVDRVGVAGAFTLNPWHCDCKRRALADDHRKEKGAIMRMRLIRNLAGLYLFATLLLGQVGVRAEQCQESCIEEIGSCIWFNCTESCEWAADWCDDWCGYDVPTNDPHYFLCSPDSPPTTNDGYCDCNGEEPNPGG
jgi:hypothetical protein